MPNRLLPMTSMMVITSCHKGIIGKSSFSMAEKKMPCIKYISKLAFPIIARIGLMNLMYLDNCMKINIKKGNRKTNEKYL